MGPASRCCALLLAVLFFSIISPLVPPTAVVAAVDAYAPVLPAERERVIAQTEGRLSSYDLDLAFDPAAATLSGRERVAFVNDTGTDLTEIAFRLFPNAFYYDEGNLEIKSVRVDGNPVDPTFASDDTAMLVPLAEPLPPGGETTVSFRFTTVVPADSTGTFGVFSHDVDRDAWILADWYPIVAGWEPGPGWRLDPPTELGDPTFSEAAFYDLSLTAPAGYAVVSTGDETATSGDGETRRWQIVTGPVRELTMVIDDDLATVRRTVDGTRVTVYTEADGTGAAGADAALAAAVESLSVYSDLFGAYPYGELDLIETEMARAFAVSWTGLIFLSSDRAIGNERAVEENPESLAFTVAHEVGHQWWGASVGINGNDHSFLVEGLTNYLSVVAFERTAGNRAARAQLENQIALPYLAALENAGDGVADLPITVPRDGPSRPSLDYGKSALGFLAIRQEIGDEAFFGALRAWAEAFAFRIAEPSDLLSAFERASGENLGDLWRFWFQAAETTPADVELLVERAY